jgi:hypothetical protein
MPAKRATRQKNSMEDNPGNPGQAQAAGGLLRSPPMGRPAGAVPRSPRAGPSSGALPRSPVNLLEDPIVPNVNPGNANVGPGNINLNPPRYEQVVQPEPAFVPYLQEMLLLLRDEARQSRQLHELAVQEFRQSRQEAHADRRSAIIRHDALVQAMQMHDIIGEQEAPVNNVFRPVPVPGPRADNNANNRGQQLGDNANGNPVGNVQPGYGNVPFNQGHFNRPEANNRPQANNVNLGNGPRNANIGNGVRNGNFVGDNAPHVQPQAAMAPPAGRNNGNGNGDNSMHHLKHVEIPKYTGSADKKTPYDFIIELQKYKAISRSSEEFMLQKIVPAALEGDAYNWYRQENELAPFINWEEFVSKFRREFQALGYTELMRRDLDNRTQGPSESLTQFIRVISFYYECLGIRPTDGQIITRVLRQMHPEYMRILHGRNIHTLVELKEAAFQAQEIIKQSRLYQPPKTENVIEPSLAWHPVTRGQDFSRDERPLVPNFEGNRNNPRVHFASVDPFLYHHATNSGRRSVTFQENIVPPEDHRSNRAPIRTPSPQPSNTREFRSGSPVQSGNRERSNSTGSLSGPRLCFRCRSPDHTVSQCPHPAPARVSPNSENGPVPSPPRT